MVIFLPFSVTFPSDGFPVTGGGLVCILGLGSVSSLGFLYKAVITTPYRSAGDDRCK